MKKKLCACFSLLFILSACAAGINRNGYDAKKLNYDFSNKTCKIAIKKNADFPEDKIEILGEIKAYDTGCSLKCSESLILSLFLEDACALGADVVNIIKEDHPNPWKSACYQAEAQLVKILDPELAANVKTDRQYAPELIVERSKITEEIAQRAISAGLAGGLSGGMVGGGAIK